MTAPAHAVVDIHAHYRHPDQAPVVPAAWVSEERAADQLRHAEEMSSIDRIVEVADEASVDVRVLSLPAASRFEDYDGTVPAAKEVAGTNDYLAEAVRRYPDRIMGLATIDAFAGEEAADEVRRAVEDLGLHGIVVDSARADLFLGHDSTLPALEAAAGVGAPVFVHPAGLPITPALIDHAGQLGSSYGRGLANGTALLTLVHRGILERLGDLTVVFTTLGIGAIGIAGTWRRKEWVDTGRVLFDTMGFDADNVAHLVRTLGADNVTLGSDWPHQVDATPERVRHALTDVGLSDSEQEQVRAGNALRVLRAGRS